MNSLFIFKKIKMATSRAGFKWTDDKIINLIKCLQEFDSSYFSRTWSNNSDITLACWSITNLNFCWLQSSYFLARFRFSLLTFMKFPIYPMLLYFNPGWKFSYNCNFFQLGILSWNFNLEWKSPCNQTLNVVSAHSL